MVLITVTKDQNILKKKTEKTEGSPERIKDFLHGTTGLMKIVQRESHQQQSTFTSTIWVVPCIFSGELAPTRKSSNAKINAIIIIYLLVNDSFPGGRENQLELGDAVTKQLQMTKTTKTTRGNQVKVASVHKPPNSKDLCLLKQSKCHIFS